MDSYFLNRSKMEEDNKSSKKRDGEFTGVAYSPSRSWGPCSTKVRQRWLLPSGISEASRVMWLIQGRGWSCSRQGSAAEGDVDVRGPGELLSGPVGGARLPQEDL